MYAENRLEHFYKSKVGRVACGSTDGKGRLFFVHLWNRLFLHGVHVWQFML